MEDVKTKGVLLIAMGYPQYGNWAAQLALSIHFTAPDVKISIATDKVGISQLTDEWLKEFDQIISIPDICYNKGYLQAKTFMYELSPYDTTIFLDADQIWLPARSIEEIFEELKDIDFTIQCRGAAELGKASEKHIHWTTPANIMENYPEIAKDKLLYHISSEVVYFKKSHEMEAFFDLVKDFQDPGVEYKSFGLQVPDELPFTLALLHSDMKPHKCPWMPVYWEAYLNKRMRLPDMYKQYYSYSLGGNAIDAMTRDTFNNFGKFYQKRARKKWYYPARSKNSFIVERKHI